ncbi:hypothetical protein D6D19_04817 [Aureobasidium pullulans]|uniref:histidine kinase n=1 Tax=Aureobasidium pullulans TaxID=5580 RepID=A0A4S9A5V2_AURPU|nr:hypothetical protein D6D19_04817 [Aureobasidium pullulans]
MAPPHTPYTAKHDGELEGARAREFYKYYEPYDNLMRMSNEKVNADPDGSMCSFDDALGAFAQFICLRLNVHRCLISCFDRNHQYVLAEATRTLDLESHTAKEEKDRLWLGAGILDRQSMLCERTLELAERKQHSGHDRVVVFPDVVQDDWYKNQQPPVRMPEGVRFYAGTAIRSYVGPVIGVISIMDENPRVDLSDADRSFLKYMADTIMSHLDMVRSKEEHRRTSQMVIGLGSYVEGKASVDEDLHNRVISAAHEIDRNKAPGETPDVAVNRPPEIAVSGTSFPASQADKDRDVSQPPSENLQNSMLSDDVKSTFHRAASIIKDAIDVDGVVFLDASVGSYGGLVQSVPAHEDASNSYFARSAASKKDCHILACVGRLQPDFRMTERFLHSLLTRYAPGRIFNIDQKEPTVSMTHPQSPNQPEDFEQQVVPEEAQHSDPETREENSELSFLRAFGISIMSEVAKLDSAMADRAKSDLLNSISHELRSPLHGILGSIECLESSSLDTLQRGLVETVDVCGRTLLDTIEHLLDFSKINNFTRNKAKQQIESDENKANMLSLNARNHLPTIIQEAIETVYAGHSSYAPSHRSPDSDQHSSSKDLEKHNVQLIVEIDAKEYGDWLFSTEGGAWRRMVMNLTGNSLKYTKDGHVHVHLQAEDVPRNSDGLDRSRITLTINDTGRGISKEYLQNHLFRPFAQEDPLQSGAGLGLSMVQQIVKNMGGEVYVQSELDKGTEVRIEVIMLKASSSAVDAEAASPMPEAREELRGSKAVYIDPPTTPTGESPTQRSFRKVLDRQCWNWFNMEFETVSSVDEVKNAEFVVTASRNLPEMKDRLIEIAKPAIIFCENSPGIRQAYEDSETLRQAVATNFIAQPFGPRKLANALVLCKKQRGQVLENITIQRDTDLFTCPVPQRDKQKSTGESISQAASAPTPAPESKANGSDANEKASTEAGQDGPKPLRLLLVDDNKINLQLLVRYCKSKKHDYVTAEDGVEAVEAFASHQTDSALKFDFVCMDISMPRMDGLEATRRIRSFEHSNELTACKVLALTGLASAEAQQEAFSSGVDQFMTKPVRLKELGEVLSGARR